MFSEANTLMIETDECQVHDWFENALIVDRYGREDVWPVPEKEFRDQRSILNSIENDLFKLMDAQIVDVRQAIQETEFGEYLRPAKQVSAGEQKIEAETAVDKVTAKM